MQFTLSNSDMHIKQDAQATKLTGSCSSDRSGIDVINVGVTPMKQNVENFPACFARL